ncbi:uncharacterized protein LOC118927260 [Manis pentadactyla]|uniref:uncharacterized protein LOC118927260 n=1 Tax=Manis pentadactyla TaxID=143292 RepID=UPI00255D11C0|nr:uncharacterized protein LOC118927260 [Manis pentadactyla]
MPSAGAEPGPERFTNHIEAGPRGRPGLRLFALPAGSRSLFRLLPATELRLPSAPGNRSGDARALSELVVPSLAVLHSWWGRTELRTTEAKPTRGGLSRRRRCHECGVGTGAGAAATANPSPSASHFPGSARPAPPRPVAPPPFPPSLHHTRGPPGLGSGQCRRRRWRRQQRLSARLLGPGGHRSPRVGPVRRRPPRPSVSTSARPSAGSSTSAPNPSCPTSTPPSSCRLSCAARPSRHLPQPAPAPTTTEPAVAREALRLVVQMFLHSVQPHQWNHSSKERYPSGFCSATSCLPSCKKPEALLPPGEGNGLQGCPSLHAG